MFYNNVLKYKILKILILNLKNFKLILIKFFI